jgi:hypothetical protein
MTFTFTLADGPVSYGYLGAVYLTLWIRHHVRIKITKTNSVTFSQQANYTD